MSSPGTLPNEWLRFAPKPRALTGGDKWNVFLSYRSVNRPWVLNLYDVLRHQGHEVYIDQVALKAGDQLIHRLQEALQSSQSGVLIWSAATGDSDWVNREYEALERMATAKQGFQFIPIVLDSSKLPLFAQSRVYLNFSEYPDGPNGGELLRLLYAIAGEPLSPEAAHFASEQDAAAQEADAKIAAALKNGNADRLVKLAREGGLVWQTSSAPACKTAESLTKLGRNDDAIDVLNEVSKRFPRAVRPRQLLALALARRAGDGDLEKAQDILGELYENGERDPETLGIYARTWMDRYQKSHDLNDLKQSRDLYAEAFERAPDDYYTGVNAAAKSILLDTDEDRRRAAGYAEQVQKIVGTSAKPGDYWLTATIAEVLLMQKKYAEAGAMYENAVATARQQSASHLTTWKQACRLMAALHPSDEERALIRKPFASLPDCAPRASS